MNFLVQLELHTEMDKYFLIEKLRCLFLFLYFVKLNIFFCQVYKESFNADNFIDIFDGFLQITFTDSRIVKLFTPWSVVVHKNANSINHAKKFKIVSEDTKKIQMDVHVE